MAEKLGYWLVILASAVITGQVRPHAAWPTLASPLFTTPGPPSSTHMDSEETRKVLGSSVVTSVSIITDHGNGTRTTMLRNNEKEESVPSPGELLRPDQYEFYTFDETGELVKRIMSWREIQTLIANGETDGLLGESPILLPENIDSAKQPPIPADEFQTSGDTQGVHNVIESVQNVLKGELAASKYPNMVKPELAAAAPNWSLFLPGLLEGSDDTGIDFNNLPEFPSPSVDFQETAQHPLFFGAAAASKTTAIPSNSIEQQSKATTTVPSNFYEQQYKTTAVPSNSDEQRSSTVKTVPKTTDLIIAQLINSTTTPTPTRIRTTTARSSVSNPNPFVPFTKRPLSPLTVSERVQTPSTSRIPSYTKITIRPSTTAINLSGDIVSSVSDILTQVNQKTNSISLTTETIFNRDVSEVSILNSTYSKATPTTTSYYQVNNATSTENLVKNTTESWYFSKKDSKKPAKVPQNSTPKFPTPSKTTSHPKKPTKHNHPPSTATKYSYKKPTKAPPSSEFSTWGSWTSVSDVRPTAIIPALESDRLVTEQYVSKTTDVHKKNSEKFEGNIFASTADSLDKQPFTTSKPTEHVKITYFANTDNSNDNKERENGNNSNHFAASSPATLTTKEILNAIVASYNNKINNYNNTSHSSTTVKHNNSQATKNKPNWSSTTPKLTTIEFTPSNREQTTPKIYSTSAFKASKATTPQSQTRVAEAKPADSGSVSRVTESYLTTIDSLTSKRNDNSKYPNANNQNSILDSLSPTRVTVSNPATTYNSPPSTRFSQTNPNSESTSQISLTKTTTISTNFWESKPTLTTLKPDSYSTLVSDLKPTTTSSGQTEYKPAKNDSATRATSAKPTTLGMTETKLSKTESSTRFAALKTTTRETPPQVTDSTPVQNASNSTFFTLVASSKPSFYSTSSNTIAESKPSFYSTSSNITAESKPSFYPTSSNITAESKPSFYSTSSNVIAESKPTATTHAESIIRNTAQAKPSTFGLAPLTRIHTITPPPPKNRISTISASSKATTQSPSAFNIAENVEKIATTLNNDGGISSLLYTSSTSSDLKPTSSDVKMSSPDVRTTSSDVHATSLDFTTTSHEINNNSSSDTKTTLSDVRTTIPEVRNTSVKNQSITNVSQGYSESDLLDIENRISSVTNILLQTESRISEISHSLSAEESNVPSNIKNNNNFATLTTFPMDYSQITTSKPPLNINSSATTTQILNNDKVENTSTAFYEKISTVGFNQTTENPKIQNEDNTNKTQIQNESDTNKLSISQVQNATHLSASTTANPNRNYTQITLTTKPSTTKDKNKINNKKNITSVYYEKIQDKLRPQKFNLTKTNANKISNNNYSTTTTPTPVTTSNTINSTAKYDSSTISRTNLTYYVQIPLEESNKNNSERFVDTTTKNYNVVPTNAGHRTPGSGKPTQIGVELHPPPFENMGLEASVAPLGDDVKRFVNLCNELAFKIWTTHTSKGFVTTRSIVLSPFAAISTLAMLFLGARGSSSGTMNEFLRLDDMVTFNPHQVFKNVTDSVVNAKNAGVANAAFVREIYMDKDKGKILDFYKERAQQYYDGQVEEANFSVIGDVVRRKTNMLVKKQTIGRMQDYIRGTTLLLRPPLAAISANIFQTDCELGSTDGRDGEMYFVVRPSNRQRRLVPIPSVVFRSGFLAGYEPSLDATAVSLNPESGVSTVFVLPGQVGQVAPGDGLARLEQRLLEASYRRGGWSRLLRSLLARPGLEVQLPRFSHRSVLNLTGGLNKMGLSDIFASEKADLRGINGLSNQLHLSDMVQVNLYSTCGETNIGARHHIESYPTSPQRIGRQTSHYADSGDHIPTPNDHQNLGADYRSQNERTVRHLLEKVDHPNIDDQNELDGDLQKASDIHSTEWSQKIHRQPKNYTEPSDYEFRQARIPEVPKLKFDRPFLYIVRHNPSGMILYIGRFNPRLLP